MNVLAYQQAGGQFGSGGSGTGGGLPAGLAFTPPTLTVSTAGSGNGSVALSGNTSGSCTWTTNATGTIDTSSCTLSAPALGLTLSPGDHELALSNCSAGSIPNINNVNTTSNGFCINNGQVALDSSLATGTIEFATGISTLCGGANSACLMVQGGQAISFSSGNVNSTNTDVGISRQAAGLLAVGAGATADETGLLRSANSCRVTTDITLTVNTNVTVCSWTLPAIAKAWAWQCEIPWVVSAGTGTNTLAILANPSQTPTAATNGFAEILTTNTGTATEQTTAISASGATTLLTSPTLTPSATVFSARTSGTLLASGTAGTFTIQMNAAGTTATAAAKAGATCQLY